jgi:hypothetical protein
LSSEKILQFFNIVTNGCKPQTKRVRFSHLVGIYLRPHDLRRHAATDASRVGVPIEIISKIILRHAIFIGITRLPRDIF